MLSGRNIPGLKIVDPTQVNVYDVLDCKTLLVSQEALAKLEERLIVMKNLYEVIRRPLITEKSTNLKELQHTLCFEVHRDATKPEIKKAVESLFSVKVADVRVASVHGKVKRQGRYSGQRPDWKKAYVVLAKDQKMIEFFDQA